MLASGLGTRGYDIRESRPLSLERLEERITIDLHFESGEREAGRESLLPTPQSPGLFLPTDLVVFEVEADFFQV